MTYELCDTSTMYGYPMDTEQLEEIVALLSSVSETLGERSLELLRQAIEAGSGRAPKEEKIISQARRSIDKAIHLLSNPSPTND